MAGQQTKLGLKLALVSSNLWMTGFLFQLFILLMENSIIYSGGTCCRNEACENPQIWHNQEQRVFHSDMKPIGFAESCFKEKNGIPRQPSVCPSAKAKLCVTVEGFTNPEHSLEGLEKFSHVW